MIRHPATPDISHMVFDAALGARVEVVAPVKVIWTGRIRSNPDESRER